jgi:hypothetical protein
MIQRQWLLVAFIAAFPCAAQGQYRPQPRFVLGFNGILARPVGEFQQFVNWGGGFGTNGVINFDEGRHIGLRLDGSFVIYGHERYSTVLSPTIRRVWVDVNTDNFIFQFGVGPQITLGNGPVRPYLYGTVGFSYFATVSSVSGTADFDNHFSSTNFDHFTGALAGGAGLQFRLSRGRHPVAIDMSVQSTYNGEAEYLTRGDIVENPDGSITLYTIRSQANLVTFKTGITIGF